MGHDARISGRRLSEDPPRRQRTRRAAPATHRGEAQRGVGAGAHELGHLLETFVVGEISSQLDWLDAPTQQGHWRTHDGDEVDLVVEREDGKIAAVEVKAASRVPARELRGLFKLRRQLGSQFLGGVVLYTGTQAYAHPDGIYVAPISRLWHGGTTHE